jgi:hypothetical protein
MTLAHSLLPPKVVDHVPALTIGSYEPQRGPAPLHVRAVAAVTAGRFATFIWRWRRLGDAAWQIAAANPASDPDHTFIFSDPGPYEISLRGEGPEGTDETVRQRIVTVEAAAPPPEPERPALPSYADFLWVEGPEVDAAYLTRDRRPPSPADIRHTAWRRLIEGWTHENILHDIRGEPLDGGRPGGRPGPPPPPVPPGDTARLTTVGTTFRRPDGSIWKWRGVTAFTALQDFLNGRDLSSFAAWTRSIDASVWRSFGMWSLTNFDVRVDRDRYYRGLDDLLAWMSSHGLYLHFVAFTDQTSVSPIRLSESEQDEHLRRVIDVCRPHPNVFLEVVNEDWNNGVIAARFPADWFRGVLSTRSAWLDGQNPSVAGSLLDWTTEHTPRGPGIEWTRKAKHLLETARQGLGDYPPTGKPAVSGEPMGVAEVAQEGRRSNVPREFADYFAVIELFAAGGNIHGDGENLQRCNVPGPQSQACCEAVRDVWRAGIPTDAASDGQYTRGGLSDCPLEHRDRFVDGGEDRGGSLRTFAMLLGSRATAVVVQPGDQWDARARNGWRIVDRRGPQQQIIFLER